MTRSELKSAAKKQIKNKIGILFVMYLIVFAIGLVCGFIPVIGAIIAIILSPAFSISFYMVYLKLANDEEISVGNVFDGFKITGKALWLNIITNIFTFLWSLLFVIPGIVKSYAYSMAPYILADNPELTAREALSRSKEIMKGHKFDLFVLQISFFWWYLLCGITFGIGSIYVIPYIGATLVNFYNSIK